MSTLPPVRRSPDAYILARALALKTFLGSAWEGTHRLASGTLGFVVSKITFPRGAAVALVAVGLYGGHWLLKSESATRVARDVSMASSELRRVREELQETNSKLDAIVGVLSPKPMVKALPAIKPAPRWIIKKPPVPKVVTPKKSIF